MTQKCQNQQCSKQFTLQNKPIICDDCSITLCQQCIIKMIRIKQQNQNYFIYKCIQCNFQKQLQNNSIENFKINKTIFKRLKKDEELALVIINQQQIKLDDPQYILELCRKYQILLIGNPFEALKRAFRVVQKIQQKIDKGDPKILSMIALGGANINKIINLQSLLTKLNNLYQIGGLKNIGVNSLLWIIPGIYCVYQIGSLFKDLINKKITGKDFLKLSALKIISVITPTVGVCVGSAVGASLGVSLIGLKQGNIWTLIIGGLIGYFIFSNFGKSINSYLNSLFYQQIEQYHQNLYPQAQQIYLKALQKNDCTINTSYQQIEKRTKKYLIKYHPDKHINQSDQQKQKNRQKFIEHLNAYEIIKNYRQFVQNK